MTDSERKHALIKVLTQHFVSRDDLQQAILAPWFVKEGTPEQKALAVLPSAIAHWADWEPETVLEIVYRLLEEINYHTVLENLKDAVEYVNREQAAS